MTTKLDNVTCSSIRLRLRRVKYQIDIAKGDDFPFQDSKDALERLTVYTSDLERRLAGIEGYSLRLQQQLALQVLLVVDRVSDILGIIQRSGSMRNSFELYVPFREICANFFDGDIHLVMSSEWRFIPFTYPMNLEQLPDFIVIGLPASESGNVLVFPTAGHELGHSIWLHQSLSQRFASRVNDFLEHLQTKRPGRFNELLVALVGPEDNDLFRTQFLNGLKSEIATNALKQIEELFCDFIAVRLFGVSYLRAFQYLLAPGIGDRSTGEYPPLHERVAAINAYALKIGIDTDGFLDQFESASTSTVSSYERTIHALADEVRREIVAEVEQLSIEVAEKAGVHPPRSEVVNQLAKRFKIGVPGSSDCTLGELLSAAWDVALCSKDDGIRLDDEVDFISDIVLKTAEAQTFERDHLA